jgi:DNA-binding winged helix-turn-helix (wHTH) protein/TolB-like protein
VTNITAGTMHTPTRGPQAWAFGPFVCDRVSRRLLRDGVPVHITARLLDVLVVLLEHAGEPVDKDRLLRLVWGDVAIEEGNLTRAVSALRKVLEEQPDHPRYIVTLPGRGYQFIAIVRAGSRDGFVTDDAVAAPIALAPPPPTIERTGVATHRWRLAAAALLLVSGSVWPGPEPGPGASAAGPSRVVVLPFRNLGVAEDDYFTAGMTEEITSRLAAATDLRVTSRTTANRYQRSEKTAAQIGAELAVDYLLEGSVRWDRATDAAGSLRVTAQLVRVADDTHLWTATWHRELRELFDVQADIAARVALELRGAIAPDRMPGPRVRLTSNVDAWQAFVKGAFFAGQPDRSEANTSRIVGQYARAGELDPTFALAQVALARAHEAMFRFGYDRSDTRRSMAARALERAEVLAPAEPEVLLARSSHALTFGHDPERALEAASRAARLRPQDSALLATLAHTQLVAGRWTDAAATFERAAILDPGGATTHATLGLAYVGLRRYGDAEAAVDRALALEADQVMPNVLRVWNAWLWRGDLPRTRAWLDRLPKHRDWRFAEARFLQSLYERRPDAALDALRPHAGEWMRTWILARPVALLEAQAHRLRGDRTEARRAFDAARELLELEAVASPDDGRIRASLSIARAGLGNREGTRQEARRALALMRFPQAFDAATVREDVALALTMIGDEDAALDEIERLLASPAHFSIQLLRLDPRWDPLRSHPRYRGLMGSDPGT